MASILRCISSKSSPTAVRAEYGQGAGGPALRGIAAARQVGLGDGLGLFGALGGLGIDQDDFQRRVPGTRG